MAEAVRAALAKRKWSVRGAAIYTGLHPTTIDRLKKGLNVETEALIRFAAAVAVKGEETETARHYLRLADKVEIVALLDAVERAAQGQPAAVDGRLTPTGELVEVIVVGRPAVQFVATAENLALIAHLMDAINRARGSAL